MAEDARLISDNPIDAFENDLLNREPFIRALLNVFRAWNAEEGLVIGLHAHWGEGKTSVINLLVPLLEKEGFSVIRFNPWTWSDRDRLQDIFFDELAVELGHISRAHTAELAKKLRRYAERLKGTTKAAALLAPVMKVVLGAAGLLALAGFVWPHRFLNASVIFLLALSLAAAFSSKFLEAISSVLNPKDKELDPTLDQIRVELKRELESWQGRIVIVMDDLDRLSAEMAADVIRLVKANGDLPRVCYTLVGDRNIIASHVGKKLDVDGHDYLEKIIQFSFDLPSIDDSALRRVLSDGMREIIIRDAIFRDFDPEYWGEVFRKVIPLLGTLRKIKRFLETFKFHVEMLSDSIVLECNISDLIGIEVVRTISPQLYERVEMCELDLTLTRPEKFGTEALAKLFQDIQVDQRSELEDLLVALFPVLSARADEKYPEQLVLEWNGARRICTSAYFHRYFRFAVAPGTVSDSALQPLFEDLSEQAVLELLTRFANESQLETVIDRLLSRVKSIRSEMVPRLIATMLTLGDRLSLKAIPMWAMPTINNASRLVDLLLERLPKQERKAVLEGALTRSTGIKLGLNILSGLDAGSLMQSACDPDKDTLSRWKIVIVNRIYKLAKDNVLLGSEDLETYLRTWREWGDAQDVRTYLEGALHNRESALSFIRGLTHVTQITGGKSKERSYIRHTEVSLYIEPEKLYEILGIKNERDGKLVLSDHPELGYFLQALKRYRAHLPDEGTFPLGEEPVEAYLPNL